MINVLVLFSGNYSASAQATVPFTKNLTEIHSKPLVQHVIEHLSPISHLDVSFTYVLRHSEDRKFHTGAVLELLNPGASIVKIPDSTSGAACSVLLAIHRISPDSPLIIVNGDQIITAGICDAVQSFRERDLDGGILVFKSVHPRWSFVRVSPSGLVIETAEKRPISNLATAGFYYFKKGGDFIKAASAMIRKDAHVNGSFYVCPSYNELILEDRKIGIHEIPREHYHTLATPSDLSHYEKAFSA